MTVIGDDSRLELAERIGVAFARVHLACEGLPTERVALVADTLEHAAELLEAETARGC